MLNYTQIEKKNERELGVQMERMNLSQGESQAMDTGMQFGQKMLFNDSFFINLLKKELPRVAFCSKTGADSAKQ